ncbi:hypothetical protein [Streptomyces sp. NBC_00057]|uniref:hypothetical protein n=1 Tax=Streptomyces sp. NBC_00057 TaxID=2975634 RepID=UPI003255CD61
MSDPLWIGTYHGRHDGTQATATATRDDTSPEPYAWTCTCGATRTLPTEEGLHHSAWRHTHPTLMDRLRQRAARYRRALQSRRTGSLAS